LPLWKIARMSAEWSISFFGIPSAARRSGLAERKRTKRSQSWKK
jgi:hypothetical protein